MQDFIQRKCKHPASTESDKNIFKKVNCLIERETEDMNMQFTEEAEVVSKHHKMLDLTSNLKSNT